MGMPSKCWKKNLHAMKGYLKLVYHIYCVSHHNEKSWIKSSNSMDSTLAKNLQFIQCIIVATFLSFQKKVQTFHFFQIVRPTFIRISHISFSSLGVSTPCRSSTIIAKAWATFSPQNWMVFVVILKGYTLTKLTYCKPNSWSSNKPHFCNTPFLVTWYLVKDIF